MSKTNFSVGHSSRSVGFARAAATLCVLTLGFGACSDDDGGSGGGGSSGAAKGGRSGSGTGGRGGSVITGGTAGSGMGGSSKGGSSTGGASGGGGSPTDGSQSGGASGAGGGSQGTGGGAQGSGGKGGSSTADGGQPIGTLCVNNSNCSQATGKTICCAITGCAAPCECILEADCPGGTPYLPCNQGSDCARWGGGKVCCETGSGAQTMRFCTKPSGCSGGRVIP